MPIEYPHTHHAPYARRPAPHIKLAAPDYHSAIRPHAERVKHYRDDFEKHDRLALADYSGPFLWGCRESGTNLILLDGEPRTQLNQEFAAGFMFGGSNDYFLHGRGGIVKKITAERARNIWDEYQRTIETLPIIRTADGMRAGPFNGGLGEAI